MQVEDYVYVANSDSNTVSVIDPTTNTVIKNITQLGIDPISIAILRMMMLYT